MTRRRCCCGCTTYIWDTFHRGDSTDLGDDWTEESGDWEIDTNELKCDSTSGVLLCDVEAPAFPFRLCVDVATLSGTDEARVYWNWVDANNHFYLSYTSAGGWKVYQVVSGSGTQLYEGTGYTDVGICVYATYFSISKTNGGDYVFPFSLNEWQLLRYEASASKVCGVGTGAVWGGTSSFDHFAIMKLAGDAPMDVTGSTPTGVNLCFACGECTAKFPPDSRRIQYCKWGTRQQQYTVTLPAFTCHADCVSGCSGCSSLAGDYVVSSVPEDIYDSGHCEYTYVFDPPLVLSCSNPSVPDIEIETLVMVFGEYIGVLFTEPYIWVYFTLASYDNRRSPQWVIEDIAGMVDCTSLSDIEVPIRAGYEYFEAGALGPGWVKICDPDGASATVNS